MPLFRGQLKHIRGLTDYKDSVLVASTNNVGITSTISSVDGVTLSQGNRILLVGQTTTTENGIYTSQSDGTIARAFDADSTAEFSSGMTVYVEQGTSNGKSTWLLITTGEIVLGTTSLQFQKQSQIYDSLEGTYGGTSKSLTLAIQKNGIITTVTENTLDSDNVTEGSSNLYHTTARARASISASGSNLSYNSSTGSMSFTSASLTPGTGISGDNFDTSTNKTFAIDTSVVPTLSSGVSVFTNDAGYITDYTVTESDVTTHQAALSITESQISNLGSYITGIDSSAVTTALGFTPYNATNPSGYITSYTVTESDVTTHQAALSITESQISDLSSYITDSSTDTLTNKSGNVSMFTNDAGYLTSTGTAAAAGTVYVDESEDDNINYNVAFLDTAGAGNGHKVMQVDNGGLTFNPYTNTLTVQRISSNSNSTMTTLLVSSSLTSNNNTYLYGSNTYLGNASTDNIHITGSVTTNVLPSSDGSLNLGESAHRWDTVYTEKIATSSGSVTVPAVTGTLSVVDATETLDNKSIDGGSF